MTDVNTHQTAGIESALALPKALLYFTAEWCGPCKMFRPVLEIFAETHPDVKIIKIDVDTQRDVASLYAVRGIPTVISLEFGAEKARSVGLIAEAKLDSMFE